MERIGIVAGAGKLPIIFANEARRRGVKVIGFAIKEMASPDFDKACDKAHRLGVGEVKKFFFLLLTERIRKIAMLGKVDKSIIYNNAKVDEKIKEFVDSPKDKSDYSFLGKATSEIEKVGVKVIDGIEYLGELLPSHGILTERHPSEKEKKDISFGFEKAKEIARLDIGQTVIVKNKNIISVEAMEGTNRTIERAAKICGEGFVVAKASRPQQDMRWDVPVVGPDTIELIAKNKGRVLAIEEKRMFLVDKETCVKLADQNNISIVVV